MSQKVHRVTTRLTNEIGDMVRECIEITPAVSPSEVVRRAIVCYHKQASAKLAGGEPCIRYRDGDQDRYEPVFL